jgi:hypothetical protein
LRLAATLLLLATPAFAVPPAGPAVLDDFETSSAWSAVPASGVTMKLAAEPGPHGNALRVDFDFHGGGGYAVLHRKLDLDLPENFRFEFKIRGETAPQNLELKLIDDSGENVWWLNRVNHEYPLAWSTDRVRKRQISFAWGPKGGGELRHVAALEFAITAGSGGKGTVWFDDLTIVPMPVADVPAAPVASASSFVRGHEAEFAADTLASTWWESRSGDRAPTLTLDLGTSREFGGLVLDWRPGKHATDYDIEFDDGDGRWRTVREVRGADGARDWLDLPESETRRVRLNLKAKPAGTVALTGVRVMPLEWAETPNAFLSAVARESPRGHYPRGFLGEQSYWTVVGVDGAREEALVDEDGRVEVGKGQWSLEPFVVTTQGLETWARGLPPLAVQVHDGLPIPEIATWPLVQVTKGPQPVRLTVIAFARGQPGASELVVRYRLDYSDEGPGRAGLVVAVRPFQVNPPSQFLNISGGAARIRSLRRAGDELVVNDAQRLRSSPQPRSVGMMRFDEGDFVARLAAASVPNRDSLTDATGRGSAALQWTFEFNGPGVVEVDVRVPLHDGLESLLPFSAADAERWQQEEERRWQALIGNPLLLGSATKLNDISATLHAQLAYVLVNRDSAGIQPGSRSYERSWIRDGALTSSALLHAGMAQPVKEFLLWYADHQYADGKVPCCVDHRGSDPVPENDSHGEFVFLAAEYLRLTGDRETAERVYPHVRAAVAYQDTLRAQRRTPEWRKPENAPYYGLLPPSISHEGYSAKPMHSYWDDLFALRGYKDAVWLAQQLGKKDDAKWMAKSRDEFARDFSRAAIAAMKAHKIDYIPGCSDLGDFDATSTTIALSPVQAGAVLPESALVRTFERYWEYFQRRRDGREAWDAFTPYEMRNIGAFVRLGWREQANELLDWFMLFRRPAGWRQWAEVVDHDERHARFIGDMPHTWVGTDFVRSVMDMLAYERESDSTLVLCAGIPEKWTADGRLKVDGLRTRWGTLAYTLGRKGDALRLTLDSSALRVPPGGIEFAPSLPPRSSHAWIGPPATQVGARFVKLDADGRYRWRPSGDDRTPPPELEWTFKAPVSAPAPR